MAILIGTDEAGYGPNLGPLVITATCWEIPDEIDVFDLWPAVASVICQERPVDSNHLQVSDSKKVYSSSSGLKTLETSVLSFIGQLQSMPNDSLELGNLLDGSRFENAWRQEPWTNDSPLQIPIEADSDALDRFSGLIDGSLNSSGIKLLSIRSRAVFTPEFNAEVESEGSKGLVLSKTTLSLIREVLDSCGEESTGSIICDKHGGRNRYDDLISEAFDDELVFRLDESREQSTYRMADYHFSFMTKAESHLPVALASMVSKYVRELLMLEFNRFWNSYLPNLKPTKGYPVDARRFWKAIAQTASRIGISRNQLWRER